VRIRDLFRPERLRELVAANLDELAPVMVHLGGAAPTAAEADAWIADALAAGERLRPYVGDASRFVADNRPASTCCSRAPRARCSTSITAPTRS
jgi:adenylosuccinate synthase